MAGNLIQGNALQIPLQDESVQLCCFSPPYWSLRKYSVDPIVFGDSECEHEWGKEILGDTRAVGAGYGGNTCGDYKKHAAPKPHIKISQGQFCRKCNAWKGHLGLEPSIDLFLDHLMLVMVEVWRILRNDGCVFINLGDSYAGRGQRGHRGNGAAKGVDGPKHNKPDNVQPKSLCLIPQKFAIRCQEAGWIVRSEIIFSKKNPMPECLSPNTELIVKENNIIKKMTLDSIYSARKSLKTIKVASPAGWVKIHNIWETYKSPTRIELGKWGDILCSENHRFPISHDRRCSMIHNIEAKNIKVTGHNDYFLWSSLKNLIKEKQTEKEVNLLNEQPRGMIAVFDNKGMAQYKQQIQMKYGTLRKWIELHGYPVKLKNRNYCSKLHSSLRANILPLTVIQKDGFDLPRIKIRGYGEYDNKAINPIIKLTYDMGRFLGLYAAEGGFGSGRGYRTKWTFHKKESGLANFICRISKKIGLDAIISMDPRCNAQYVRVSGRALQDFLSLFIKGKCKTKTLNLSRLLNTPFEFREGLWDGYVEGDGHIPKTNTVRVTSASRQLIDSFRYIVSSLGYIPSEYCNVQNDKRTGKTYNSWTVGLPYKDKRQNKKNTTWKQINPTKIQKSEEKPIRMIDIEVEGGLFLIKDGLVSHNSCKDRPTRSHEQVWMLTKQGEYFFDQEAVAQPQAEYERARRLREKRQGHKAVYVLQADGKTGQAPQSASGVCKNVRARHELAEKGTRNIRTVWTLPSEGCPEAHFAIWPSRLVELIIRAGSKRGDVVLDPFVGVGTSVLVAEKLGRIGVGMDLSAEYLWDMAKGRVDAPMQRLLF